MNAADALRFEELQKDLLTLAKRLNHMAARVDAMEAASGFFAADKELDGPKGDPSVKFAPHGWVGPDFKGRAYSQCTPEFLDALAESLAYSAKNPKPGKEKYSAWNELDAARARGWARRLRNGWQSATPAAVGEFPGDTFAAPAPFTPPTDFGATRDFEAADFSITDFVPQTFDPPEPF